MSKVAAITVVVGERQLLREIWPDGLGAETLWDKWCIESVVWGSEVRFNLRPRFPADAEREAP